jgi:hypothetical protein
MTATDGSFTRDTGCAKATLISIGITTAMIMTKDTTRDMAKVTATDTTGTSKPTEVEGGGYGCRLHVCW